MTSTDQHNLTSLPNEIKLDILELLFSDSVVSLKGRYSHPKAQPRLLPPAATRRNILLTCRSFFALGIEPFYKLSKLNLHLMLLDERRDQHPWMHTLPYPVVSLQQTQRIHLLNDRALAATVITRFRALRILRLSHLTKTTSDSHVPDARRVLDTLRGRWLCAAQAAMRVRQTKGQFQTILIRVKWEIVNWFRPGKAYDMYFEVDIGAQTVNLGGPLHPKYMEICGCGRLRWRASVENTEPGNDTVAGNAVVGGPRRNE